MPTTLGVIADTHIPDRRKSLHPALLPALERANVDAILHAGDVSNPATLKIFEEIAPVYAVKGNRDIFTLNHLPMERHLNFEGITIGLAHGHKNLWGYVREKAHMIRRKYYALHIYLDYLLPTFPNADVIVFGHSHFPENHLLNRQLIFNPGSSCCVHPNTYHAMGFLHIAGDQVRGELINLDEAV
jgi:hypothetical protein